MPAPNDLTPEEEREFVEHGRQPLGPGREPLAEENEGQPPVQQEPTQQQQEEPPQEQQQQAPQQGSEQPSRHRPDGTFKSKAEYDAEVAAWEAAQNGQPQGQQQGQQQQPPQGFVPHQALHAERERAAQATRMAQLATTRLNAILAAQGQQPPQQQQMPNPAEDPLGYLQAMEKRIEAFEQQQQQSQQERQIDGALEQDEQLFASQFPDYNEASDYYVASRARELLAFHTPEKARAIMEMEARQIAQQAWQRGQSAAEVIYGLSRARGWQPGQQPAWMGAMQQEPQPQPQQQQRQGPTAQQRVAAINNGQQQSRSLSGGGAGGQRTEQLNADALLNMSDEEFEEYLGIGQKGANARFAAIG